MKTIGTYEQDASAMGRLNAWSMTINLAKHRITGGGFDIWLVNPDGSRPRLLVTGGSNENPHWSADGRQLVFASDRDGVRSLFVSDLSDRPPRRLDTGGLPASSPAWSPRLTR